ACALCSATVVARTGNAENVADHHVVTPWNVLPQLPQQVVFLNAAWPNERADVVPARTMQRHHRPIPTEADDMAVLAQLNEIEQLYRTLADLQRTIHFHRVHDHSGSSSRHSVDIIIRLRSSAERPCRAQSAGRNHVSVGMLNYY